MKFTAAALLGLTAAAPIEINLDEIWAPRNWGKFAMGMLHKPNYHVMPGMLGGVPQVTQCDDQMHVFKYGSSSFEPKDISAGVPFTSDVKGTVSTPTTFDHMVSSVYWNGMHITDQKQHNPESFTSAVDIKMTSSIPRIAPSGKYKVHAVGYDAKDESVACFEIAFAL